MYYLFDIAYTNRWDIVLLRVLQIDLFIHLAPNSCVLLRIIEIDLFIYLAQNSCEWLGQIDSSYYWVLLVTPPPPTPRVSDLSLIAKEKNFSYAEYKFPSHGHCP